MGLPVSASYDSLPRTKTSASAAAEASHHRSSSSSRPARYRECQKNHAVSIGGHAVDGCGEFMPAGDEGTLDALKCAACGCHRNFHRKEVEGGGGPGELGFQQQPQHHHFPHLTFSAPYYRAPAGYLVAAPPHYRPPTPLALPSTSGGGAHSRDDQDDVSNNPSSSGGGGGGGVGMGTATVTRKRFRTKFTPEQKEKMREFAEKVGWRIQKHDEAAVQQFCNDACVQRHVLKVWMHNNKHTIGKKP
ncbi:hypothetical protein ACLOJK_016420 [Asimina triloba]